MPFFIYENPDLIKKLYEHSRDAAINYNKNGRSEKQIIKNVFEGKATEFAVYEMFLKPFYTEPSLAFNKYDDGGFDTVRIADNLKLDIKKRPGKFINLLSSNLRSDVYCIVDDVKITKTQIKINEPKFYSRKMMELHIQNSFNPYFLKNGWNFYIRKTSLEPIEFKDVLIS